MHRHTYINFQKNDIMKISNLQVVVVDKLFHKYVMRGLESSSKKKFKCHLLLQEILYTQRNMLIHIQYFFWSFLEFSLMDPLIFILQIFYTRSKPWQNLAPMLSKYSLLSLMIRIT